MLERFLQEYKMTGLQLPRASADDLFQRAQFRHYLRTGEIIVQRKYSPDQPRIPGGQPGGGQWTEDSSASRSDAPALLISEYERGTLVAELPYAIDAGAPAIGRKCVYRFSFGDIIVEGSKYFACSPKAFSSEVTHGQLLNDRF